MKIKKTELQKIIKEELERAVAEQTLVQEGEKVEKIKAALQQFGQALAGIGVELTDILVPDAADLDSDDPKKMGQALANISRLSSTNPDAGLFEEESEEAEPTKQPLPEGEAYGDIQEDDE
jgi:hypothetical protein